MPKLNINFDETPTEIPQLEPGVYILTIKEASIEPTKDNKSEKLVLNMVVDDAANAANGRTVYDHIGLKPPYGPVTVKRLTLSAGMKLGADGLNVDELIGKTVKARIKQRTYQDDNGETKTATSVAQYEI